jgi:hypothetical protein
MMVVLSDKRQRSRSVILRKKFDAMYTRCMNDIDYCIKGIPIRRNFKAMTGVEAHLNATSKKALADYKPALGTYIGERNISVLPGEGS